MKAALEARGGDSNLFHQGAAKESQDTDVSAATMARPGVVLRRRAWRTTRWSAADERHRELALSSASLAETANQMQRTKSSVRTRALKTNIAIARDQNPVQKGETWLVRR